MARVRASGSSRSPRTRWNCGDLLAPSRNRGEPVEKLSKPVTSCPAASNRSTRLLPIKPAAPVTNAFITAFPGTDVADRSAGPRRVARPRPLWPLAAWSGTRHQCGALEIEMHADLAQSGFPEHAAKPCFVFGVEHEEAAAARADELPAQRSIGARHLIVFVDARVGHRFRAAFLQLPVLVHDRRKAAEVALFHRFLAFISEALDLMQMLDHPRIAAARPRVLVGQNRRSGSREAGEKQQQV